MVYPRYALAPSGANPRIQVVATTEWPAAMHETVAVVGRSFHMVVGREVWKPGTPYTFGIWLRVRNTCVYPGL